MGKQQTLEALEIFIQSQRSLLSRTQSDIARLKDLRRDANHSENFFSTLDDRLDFRIDDGDVVAEVHRTVDWSLFKCQDPTALRAFTSQLAATHQSRSVPSTNQRSPLSPLQQLVKDARRNILDPVLAAYADMSEPSDDEELTPEEQRKERERQKIRELRTRRIGEGGLTLPRGCSGVFVRRDLPDESGEVDIALDEADSGDAKPDLSSVPAFAVLTPSIDVAPQPPSRPSRARRAPTKPLPADPAAKPTPTKVKRPLDPDPQPDPRPGKRSKDANKPKPDTYKQVWSVSEQHLLERLLEEIPDGEKNRWAKISKAMQGRRTPRQVASRVQKYFEKLKRFGVEIGAGGGASHMDDDDPP
ncbi:hypothetical protein OF83DRAFT_1124445 [Amylostereum chailletii]|nr:hypothetical protein OF83DRAFT_1124445 [Amylostereum chailletii]